MNNFNGLQAIDPDLSYWDQVAQIWGQGIADAVHWSVAAIYICGLTAWFVIAMIKMLKVVFQQLSENEATKKEAWKAGFGAIAKSGIALVCCAVLIPILWEIVVPVIVMAVGDVDIPTA